MKKTTLFLLAIVFLSGIKSFAGDNDKTIENLKAAFKGESTASAKYAAFAEQAKKEGLLQIAAMFQATSGAEKIHAANHQIVLVKLGQKTDAVKPEFTVKTTRENLEEAIKGESYEMTTMYPGFIATSTSENVPGASKSFRWAMETEKKHRLMYQEAFDALNAKKVNTLSSIYYVCPKCGNTYATAKPESSCSFCSTKKDKFIRFGK
jgi:rubrerythrin